jgi:D-amino-acid dehydrogenase
VAAREARGGRKADSAAWTRPPAPGARIRVLVVGGGVIGVACALYLAERGARVTLVERDEVCSGASHGNAGWVSPSLAVPLPAPGVVRRALRWLLDPESPFYVRPRPSPALARWLLAFARASRASRMRETARVCHALSLASRACYEELAKLPGLEFGFSPRGILVACATPDGLAHAREGLALLRELGGDGEELDPAALRARAPALASDLAGGVYFPVDAHVEPARLVLGLARECARRGVEIRTHTELLALERVGDRIASARTTRGAFEADEFVIAGGAWSPGIVAPLGIRLPVQPAKGYSLTFRRPDAFGETPVMLAEAKVGVTPMGEWLRFAGTLELAGLDLSVNLRRVRAIERAAQRFLPELRALEHVETWRGLRPCTPDDRPVIGHARALRNLVLATGHGMSGIAQGPITGKLVAELLTGQAPSLDLAPFSPSRF